MIVALTIVAVVAVVGRVVGHVYLEMDQRRRLVCDETYQNHLQAMARIQARVEDDRRARLLASERE